MLRRTNYWRQNNSNGFGLLKILLLLLKAKAALHDLEHCSAKHKVKGIE
jgi:hypothetical protein